MRYQLWSEIFRTEFVPQLGAVSEALEKRMLPAFDGIDEEAHAVTEKAWNDFMAMPATGDEDPSDFVEPAQQAGVAHYMLLDGVRQGMINLFAAALYHVFEQQVLLFLREELLNRREKGDPQLFRLSVATERLGAIGINVKEFASWAKIDELRLVANTAKHAEGESAEQLRQTRLDLFEHPRTREIGFSFGKVRRPLYSPLAGEDLYVSLTDIQQFRDSLIEFWRELEGAIQPN